MHAHDQAEPIEQQNARARQHYATREMTSREMLEGKIIEYRRFVEGLERLLDALPAKLPDEADAALRSVLMGMR
jgi:hypothetical protein